MQDGISQDQTVMNGVKALAAASATPFRTAFKITMGIAAAQLLVSAIFLGGVVTVFGTLIYFLTGN